MRYCAVDVPAMWSELCGVSRVGQAVRCNLCDASYVGQATCCKLCAVHCTGRAVQAARCTPRRAGCAVQDPWCQRCGARPCGASGVAPALWQKPCWLRHGL
eukprot:8219383-Pyramimonas_sp.AAC.1